MRLGRLFSFVVVFSLTFAAQQNDDDVIDVTSLEPTIENGKPDEKAGLPQNPLRRESVRNSVNCDDSNVEGCPDLTRNMDLRGLQNLSPEELGVLQKIYSRNQNPSSYVNQGNAVHIQGGFQNPVPLVHTTGNTMTLKNRPSLRPGLHFANSPPSTVNFNMHTHPLARPPPPPVSQLPSQRPSQLQSQNIRNAMTRINSKLLANITAASQLYSRSPLHHLNLLMGQNYPSRGDNRPFLGQGDLAQLLANSPYSQNPAPYPSPIPPVRNIINLKMPSAHEKLQPMQPQQPQQQQQQKADMAEILTNLQILTILMNQDAANKLDVEGTPKMPPGVPEVAKAKRKPEGGYRTPQQGGFSPAAPSYPHHKIEARTRRPSTRPQYRYPSPFGQDGFYSSAIYPKSRPGLRPPEGQRISGQGSSYFAPTKSGTRKEFDIPLPLFDEVGPLVSPYTPHELLGETQPVQVNAANDTSPADAPEEEEEEEEDPFDNEKLIHQFAWGQGGGGGGGQHSPVFPLPQDVQEVPGTETSANGELGALYNYLQFIKQYNQNLPPSSSPQLGQQDLLLAYLLQSQGLSQPTLPPQPPPFTGLQPNTPYIPAVHSGLYTGFPEVPQAPAPPPVASVAPPGTPDQPLFTPGASASSIEDCLTTKVCAFFLAALVAAGTTTALAIPIFTPILGAGFLGRRRRRRAADDYATLTPANATQFVRFFAALEGGRDMETLSPKERDIFYSFVQPLAKYPHSGDLEEYISSQNDDLLEVSAKEVEFFTQKAVPGDLLYHLKHDNLKKQLRRLKQMMNKISRQYKDDGDKNEGLTEETKNMTKDLGYKESKTDDDIIFSAQKVTGHQTDLRNDTNATQEDFDRPPALQKTDQKTSKAPEHISLNWSDYEEHLSTQEQHSSTETPESESLNSRVTTKESQGSRLKAKAPQGPPNSQRKDSYEPFSLEEGLSLILTAKKVSEGPSDDATSLSEQINAFYRDLCNAVTEPGIPKNVFVTSITQRCLLLASAKLIR